MPLALAACFLGLVAHATEPLNLAPVATSTVPATVVVDGKPKEIRYLSYEEAVRVALHNNVDLLAVRSQEESLKYKSSQAISPNEPVLSYTKADIPGFSLSHESAQETWQVTWTLGFPGKSLANSASMRQQAGAMEHQALSQEIAVMTSLSNTYIALYINESFYQFLLTEQKRDKELRRLLEKKYSASQAAKVDLLNAEAVTQSIGISILENRNDHDNQLRQFRQILRQPLDNSIFPAIPKSIDIPPTKQSVEQLIPLMLKNNHNVLGSAQQVQSSRSLLASASLMAFPDLQFTGAVNKWLPASAPITGVNRDYTVGIGITVPIFFPINELPAMRAAHQDLGAAEYQHTSQELQAISGLQSAYGGLKAALAELDASSRLVVPAAKAAFDLTLLTYSLGKADFFALNNSRKALHDANRDMLTKLQTAAQLYNQLIAQMGCDIQKPEGASNACKKD